MKEVKIKQNRNLLIVGIICLVALVGIVGYTYSFFQVRDTNTGSITGTVASTSLEVEVEKLVPSTNVGLVPQLDEYITSAVVGRNNKNCVDDNGNEVCQVYSITVENTSSVSVNVDGLVELNSGNNPNLKWAQITGYTLNMTTKPTLVSDYNLHTSKNLTINEEYEQGQEKTYYIVVWISETGEAQEDTGIFTGTVTFKLHDEKASASNFIASLAKEDACAAGSSGICATNPYTTESGETAYHEYRYRGAEVNNYVSFNNDIYRIIGVFDDYSHGVEGEYLIKIIQDNLTIVNSFGNYSTLATQNVGTYAGYHNDWIGNGGTIDIADDTSPATANILLNQFFYNKTKGLSTDTYGICQNWTYTYSDDNNKTLDCSEILGYGIDKSVRDYIEEVTWHLKGKTSNEFSKQDFYTCERSGDTTVTNCSSGASGTYDKSTTGKIGLMYVSDYIYASGFYSANDTTTAKVSYSMGDQNWLCRGYEWTITPDGDSVDYGFYINNNCMPSTNKTFHSIGIRPTMYLKSNISIISGNGSFDNPFILSK